MATDIAFALGVLALLGPRVPLGLKVFLLALAIVDDLGAILVIAIFYTEDLTHALAVAASRSPCLLAAEPAGRGEHRRLTSWSAWSCGRRVLKSGVHATLAGVPLALVVRLRAPDGPGRCSRAAPPADGTTTASFEQTRGRIEDLEDVLRAGRAQPAPRWSTLSAP